MRRRQTHYRYRPRKFLRNFFWLILTAVFLLLSLFYLLRMLYPLPYREQAFAAAAANRMDPYLVAAVIRVESKFRPQAQSSTGALGLMQVMPDTARWVARQINLPGFKAEDLYNPKINIQIGTWYLAILERSFDDDLIIALSSYNAGEGNVRSWLGRRQWSGEHQTIGDIPFPETRAYVRLVLRDYWIYRILYSRLDRLLGLPRSLLFEI